MGISVEPGRSTGAARAGAIDRRGSATFPLVFVLPGCERFTRGVVGVERLTVGRFANGELYAKSPAGVRDRQCVLVASISPPPGNLERVTLLAHALRRAGVERVVALLPSLAYARQDRAAAGESLGLAWVGALLSVSGVDEVVCVDLHSHEAGSVLGLPVRSLSPAALLAGALPRSWRGGVTFVAPDEGAIARCAAVAESAGESGPVVWVRKQRTPRGIAHFGIAGSPGRRAVVVDDILDTGATLVSCCRHLAEAGTEEIAIVATHGLFTGVGWRALLGEGVRRFWITDTVLSRRRPTQARVVPVAPLLAPILTGGDD